MYKKISSTLLKINIISSLISMTISDSTIKSSMYVSNNKLQREKVLALIDEFCEDLKNIPGKYMDIGCGPGDITNDIILPVLAPNTVVTGTDISENMIEYAKKRYTIKNRLEFKVLDIQTKTLPTEYVSEFDCILSFHTLHWCTDIRQAFENIYHMLRPNGTMLILFVASHEIFEVLKDMAQDIRYAPYIKDVNKSIWPFQNSVNPRKELKEFLQKLGFTVIHCSHRETYYFDENPMRFFFSIEAFFKFIDDMPFNRKEEFEKEFARKFAETQISYKRRNDNKTVTLNVYNVLIAFAQKYVS